MELLYLGTHILIVVLEMFLVIINVLGAHILIAILEMQLLTFTLFFPMIILLRALQIVNFLVL